VNNRVNFLYLHFFSLTLFGVFIGYKSFQNYFLRTDANQITSTQYGHKVSQLKLQNIFLASQVEDLRYERYLSQNKTDTRKNSRKTASISDQALADTIDYSAVMFTSLKKSYAEEKYEDFDKKAKSLISSFPYSAHVPEVKFLQMNLSFKNKNKAEALNHIKFLTQHFPESIFSGYALLKMAQVLEESNQKEEASEIYSIIAKKYEFDKTLKTEAERKIQNE